MMNPQLRHPRAKLRQLRSVRHGLEHRDNMDRATAVPPDARNVAFNCSQVNPEAALRDRAGKIAHSLDHPGVAWSFEEHCVAGAQQRKQSVFQFVSRVHLLDLAFRPHALVALSGRRQLTVTNKKQMTESTFS